MGTIHTGYLHTNDEYVSGMPSLDVGSDYENTLLLRVKYEIMELQDKEQAFYQKFGCNDYASFKGLIQSLFSSDYQNDMQVLQNFSSNNLRQHLHKFNTETVMLQGKPVRLSLEKDRNFSKRINDLLNELQGHTESNGFYIDYRTQSRIDLDITWDTATVKKLINILQGTHFIHSSGTTRDTADVELMKYIRTNSNLITVSSQGNNSQPIEFRSGPFQYTIEELREKDLAGDIKALQDISNKIQNFIFNVLGAGASSYMKYAIEEVWGQKMGNNLLNISFFTGGDKWINNVVGAMGEFQTAVFFQYISHRLPNLGLGSEITKIIGNETNGYKQQFHTDVQFMEAFGIQVKNYNGAITQEGKERSVQVSLHPSEVGSLAKDADVVEYIINSYFNTDVSPIPLSIYAEFFKAHADELLNLNLNPNIPDQVTFYMIGGNFIPASRILGAAFIETSIIVSDTTISGKQGKSTVEYHMGEHPDFLKWWHGNKYIGWMPMPMNSMYSWDGLISIKTKFTYSALFDGAYKLF